VAHLRDVTTSKPEPDIRSGRASDQVEFAVVYRDNVGPVTAFFARRCMEPQAVADLTSQTFVEAINSVHTYRGRGPVRAWLIAIARRVWARHLEGKTADARLIDHLRGQLVLGHDEVEDLASRIDAQQDGQQLLARVSHLSKLEREAVELVDLIDLTPKQAARVLGVSPNALRVRLFRAHAQLRKDTGR
jgi:RNA polymerase sigma factor (sigma-70 family)